LVSYGRPSYGGSTARPGRSIGDAADDVAQVLDNLGLTRFSTMGASGGGPHALACAALLPDRVSGVVTLAGIAPLTEAFDWWGGMADSGGPRAALDGRDARARYAETDEFDPDSFVAADYAALDNEWASLGDDVAASAAWGDDGLIDDDVAIVSPWGFELADITTPTLVIQGADDRVVPAAHAQYLHEQVAHSELWLREGDGHVSVLREVAAAMDWLLAKR
jgi:pimeloyl-ACP methyl ester carboxylesterase